MCELVILVLSATTFGLTVAALRWRAKVEVLEFELSLARRDLTAFHRLFGKAVDSRRKSR